MIELHSRKAVKKPHIYRIKAQCLYIVKVNGNGIFAVSRGMVQKLVIPETPGKVHIMLYPVKVHAVHKAVFRNKLFICVSVACLGI